MSKGALKFGVQLPFKMSQNGKKFLSRNLEVKVRDEIETRFGQFFETEIEIEISRQHY